MLTQGPTDCGGAAAEGCSGALPRAGAEAVRGERMAGPSCGLITSILGMGMAKENEVVWRLTEHGRPCLVSLHSWASGPQTVTTLDAARAAHAVGKHFEISTERS